MWVGTCAYIYIYVGVYVYVLFEDEDTFTGFMILSSQINPKYDKTR